MAWKPSPQYSRWWWKVLLCLPGNNFWTESSLKYFFNIFGLESFDISPEDIERNSFLIKTIFWHFFIYVYNIGVLFLSYYPKWGVRRCAYFSKSFVLFFIRCITPQILFMFVLNSHIMQWILSAGWFFCTYFPFLHHFCNFNFSCSIWNQIFFLLTFMVCSW